ncbi:MAG: ice-binding family protein [Sphaerochaeta sp.]
MNTSKKFSKYMFIIALIGILSLGFGCSNEGDPPISVTGITVTGASDASVVANGDTLQMSASILPTDAMDQSVTWSVVDGTGTATISTTGLLTGTGVGTVTVNATANDESAIEGSLVVSVTAPNTVVSIVAIAGVTVPMRSVTPVLTVTGNAEYSGTVAWEPSDSPYAASTAYTATITLTAEEGYTFNGVAADSFTVSGATSTNAVNSGVVTAVFPATEAAPDVAISLVAIPGVTVPSNGSTPDLAVTETDQYSGIVTWSPDDSPYAATTVYTATITLTAKTGYTFTGVAANSFTVEGSTATNLVDSGVITAVFPATGAAPDVAVSIVSIPGVTAPERNVTPDLAITATDQYTGTVVWSPADSTYASSTVYTATITLTALSGYTFIGVAQDSFTVSGAEATNATDSNVITAVFPATEVAPDTVVSIVSIPGVTAPVRNVTPDFAITETDQYTGVVTWSPADSPFEALTVYTATITLTAKTGFTFNGVAADSFTVAGATTTNALNTGVVTAEFPATAAAPDVAISIAAITGVTAPVRDAVPSLLVDDTDQYETAIAWTPVHDPFAEATVYTATITLTKKTGYTFTGVAANFFTVEGAIATNAINSGVVTAVFPATSDAPLVPVDLKTAGNYVILAKAAVSTIGTTAITGDLGLSPAATSLFTGFGLVDATGYATSSLVTGKLFAADMADPTPATLTTAVSDMELAFTNAAGRTTPDFLDLGSGAIGGMTLAPGLYKWNGNVGIGENLTLNGDVDAVWIFQISGTLDVAADVIVSRSGGALAENVFWQVTGDVTLLLRSKMEGIILGQTQIILQEGSTINGRLLAQTQITLDAATVGIE